MGERGRPPNKSQLAPAPPPADQAAAERAEGARNVSVFPGRAPALALANENASARFVPIDCDRKELLAAPPAPLCQARRAGRAKHNEWAPAAAASLAGLIALHRLPIPIGRRSAGRPARQPADRVEGPVFWPRTLVVAPPGARAPGRYQGRPVPSWGSLAPVAFGRRQRRRSLLFVELQAPLGTNKGAKAHYRQGHAADGDKGEPSASRFVAFKM